MFNCLIHLKNILHSCCFGFFVLVYLFGCKQDIIKIKGSSKNHYVFTIDSFSQNKQVKGTIIPLADLKDPEDFIVIPSHKIIVVVDDDGENWGKVYSLETFKFLKPLKQDFDGEKISGVRLIHYTSENKLLFVSDNYAKTIYTYSLDSLISSNPFVNPIRKVQIQNKYFERRAAIMDGGTIIGQRTNQNVNSLCQFDFYSLNGEYRFSRGNFPNYINGYERYEADQIFIGNIAASSQKNRIIKNYFTTDIIDLYDTTGSLIRRIQGPDNFDPSFYREIDGRMEFLRFTENSKLGYCAVPQIEKGGYYLLYSGKKVDKSISSGTNLFYFNSRLHPEIVYQLNIPVFSFQVDENNNILYGLSGGSKRKLVYFLLN